MRAGSKCGVNAPKPVIPKPPASRAPSSARLPLLRVPLLGLLHRCTQLAPRPLSCTGPAPSLPCAAAARTHQIQSFSTACDWLVPRACSAVPRATFARSGSVSTGHLPRPLSAPPHLARKVTETESLLFTFGEPKPARTERTETSVCLDVPSHRKRTGTRTQRQTEPTHTNSNLKPSRATRPPRTFVPG